MIDPTPDELATTVYACFGLAVHRAQTLERALVETLLLDRMPERSRLTPAEIEGFMSQQYDGTLGRLVRELDGCPSVPGEVRDLLQQALATRNWLVHDYLAEHADQLATVEGCEILVQELEAATALFEQAQQSVRDVLRPLGIHAQPLAL